MVNLEGENISLDSLDDNGKQAWSLLVDVREMLSSGMNENQRRLWYHLLDHMCAMWAQCDNHRLLPFKDEDTMIWTVNCAHAAMAMLENMQ